MYTRIAICLVVVCAAAGCGESKPVEALVECGPVTATLTCPANVPTFAQVQPILAKSCIPCHDGNMQDVWPLIEYDDVAAWAGPVKNDILTCTMPPADGDYPITDAERSTLVQWAICDTPR